MLVMTLNDYKFNVDRQAFSQLIVDMNSPNKKNSCCRLVDKKGMLMRAVLVLVTVGLTLQAVQVYLAVKNTQLTDKNEVEVPSQAPLVDERVSERVMVIIYSYPGMKQLPLGDLIAKTLADHPEVLYLTPQQSFLKENAVGFPTYESGEVSKKVDGLLSCDKKTLESFYPISHFQQFLFEDQTFDTDNDNNIWRRCITASLVALDVTQGEGTELHRVFKANSSTYFVHLAADPRFVTTSLLEMDKRRNGGIQRTPSEEKAFAEQIAKKYSNSLRRDIRTAKAQRADNSNYLFLRHETLMINPFSAMQTLFNFLELHMTEEKLELLRLMDSADLQEIYANTHKHIQRVAHAQEVSKLVNKLGYPSEEDLNEGEYQLKPIH